MSEMVQARRNQEKKDERYDLFNSLLDANEEEAGEKANRLSDDELMGECLPLQCSWYMTLIA